MSDAEIAAALVTKLNEAAASAADAPVTLVSVAIEMLEAGALSSIETRIERKTRTLVFANAEAYGAERKRIATAAAVYKILAQPVKA